MHKLNVLALDTACGDISACIIKDGEIFTSEPAENPSEKTRSTSIVPVLESLLQQTELDWMQLDALALGAGPGSFTGLRIAAATLAGINSGLKLPVFHLSSLALTARQTERDEAIWVLEDARAGEAFVGHYHNHQSVQADSCMSWVEVEALTPGCFCCHGEPPVDLPGWRRVPLTVSRSTALAYETISVCFAGLDKDMPTYPTPIYLQLSQAERNAHARV